MEVDEDRKFTLTKYSTRMGLKCLVKSDHNVLVCKLKVKWDKKVRIERKEVLKLKDTEGLRIFSEKTSNCPNLVQLSQNTSNFLEDAEMWFNEIESLKKKSFKKIRITGKAKPQNGQLETLMKAKLELKQLLEKRGDPVSGVKIKEKI